MATLSFFPAHHMTMGEGRDVVVNTCGKCFGWELGELPRGYDHKYVYSRLGYNFKPTDMQAAVGCAQLDRLPGVHPEKRRENFRRLPAALTPFQDKLILPTQEPRANASWFGFPITVHEGVLRAALVQPPETANIETRPVFGGNILKQPGYRGIPRRVHGALAERRTGSCATRSSWVSIQG